MRKFYFSALALLAGAAPALAQSRLASNAAPEAATVIARRACGTMEALEAQLAADPAQARRMAAIEAQTQQLIANPALQRSTAGTVIVPVVVHVLYNTTAENISDAQVQSQIDVLNEDYRKLNADAIKTPGIYAGLAADANVQFVLAKRDPSGLATTGVIHKSTRTTSWSTNDAVKNSKRGGDNAWDASKYLNLWACNLGQGLLGYAQFPGGSAATAGAAPGIFPITAASVWATTRRIITTMDSWT